MDPPRFMAESAAERRSETRLAGAGRAMRRRPSRSRGRTRSLFISFEGPEGSGKSTHSALLAGWLRRRGYEVVLTREPGGTKIGRQLRRIVLDHRSGDLSAAVELFLYEASRSVLVSEVIRPALQAGKIVLIDRFQDSTTVYQGWAGGLGIEFAEKIGRFATGGLVPDITFLLDLPVKKGLARVQHPNRFESKGLAFHKKVRAGYRLLARRNQSRFRVIRADQPTEKVQKKIQENVTRVLCAHCRA